VCELLLSLVFGADGSAPVLTQENNNNTSHHWSWLQSIKSVLGVAVDVSMVLHQQVQNCKRIRFATMIVLLCIHADAVMRMINS
jgi:hypothetical protein